jgi:type IV secretory pathway TrbD component
VRLIGRLILAVARLAMVAVAEWRIHRRTRRGRLRPAAPRNTDILCGVTAAILGLTTLFADGALRTGLLVVAAALVAVALLAAAGEVRAARRGVCRGELLDGAAISATGDNADVAAGQTPSRREVMAGGRR